MGAAAVPSPNCNNNNNNKRRFPISRKGLVTTAAALRLRGIVSLGTRSQFQSLLHSSVKEFSHFAHQTTLLFKGFEFGNKQNIKAFGDFGKDPPSTKSFNDRQWTNILLAINVVVFVAQIATQGKLLLWGAKINSLIDKGQLWRLATSSFLHANVGHLMVNCYSLNSVGPTMEAICGPRRFLGVYFMSAITSCAASYWFCKAPAVGASGAIFGVVGSFAVFVLRHRTLLGGGKEDLQQIGRVIALNLAIGLLSKGIDNWGHLGGLVGGAATSWFLGPAWKYESKSDDGRLIYADRAPVFYLTNRKRTAE